MKSQRQVTADLVRPWKDEWERWTLDGEGAPTLRLAQTGPPEAIAAAAGSIFSVPARLVIAVPLWIDSVDPEIVQESARLELDLRGLLARKGGGTDFVLRTIPHGTRTLVIAAVFPPGIPEVFAAPTFDRYEASPFLLKLEPDAITLWREGEDVVAAFTSGAQVVCWETTRLTDDPVELSNWLRLLWLQLSGEGVISGNLRLINTIDTIDRSRLRLPAVIQPVTLPGPVDEMMKPSLEAARFQWKPAAAIEHARALLRRKQTRQIVLAVAAAYVAVVLVLLGYWATLQFQMSSLRAQADDLGAQVALFEPVAREWEYIGPTAETEFFPLEILHNVVESLPPDGIRITEFKVEEGTATVKGEATSAPAANDYFVAITGDEELRGIQWEMPMPTLLPNSAAQFILLGRYEVR